MKRMLINASQRDEIHVALVENNKIFDLDIEQKGNQNKVGNIYKGKITKVEPSLEACFVHYGGGRDGFLPFKLITKDYLPDFKGDVRSQLKIGQEIIVQVNKEERGNKGATLTTNISLVGSYVVILPKSPDTEGISRKINDEQRSKLKAKLEKIELPEDFGVIVRTAGKEAQEHEILKDYSNTIALWNRLLELNKTAPIGTLLHKEDDIIERSLRDYLDNNTEIVVDDQASFRKVQDYVRIYRPEFSNKIIQYRKEESIFNFYGINKQIDECYQREIILPSGGVLVIDTAEALTAIDVNSARYTGGDNVESTAIITNLEAADEIARQLRLRDVGGLVVIDFIDMDTVVNRKKVEERFRQAIASDRAKINCEKISKFGLMEVSRQRIRPPLNDTHRNTCPKCNGTGRIKDFDTTIQEIFRDINQIASKGNTAQIHLFVPVEISSILINEKREDILKIEKEANVTILVIPNLEVESPNFEIIRVRPHEITRDPSYKLKIKRKSSSPRGENLSSEFDLNRTPKTEINKNLSVEQSLKSDSLFDKLFNKIKSFFSKKEPQSEIEETKPKTKNSKFSKTSSNKLHKPRKGQLTRESTRENKDLPDNNNNSSINKREPKNNTSKTAINSVKEMVNDPQKQKSRRNNIEHNTELSPKDFLDQEKINRINSVENISSPINKNLTKSHQAKSIINDELTINSATQIDAPPSKKISLTKKNIANTIEDDNSTKIINKPKRERVVREKNNKSNKELTDHAFSIESAIGRALLPSPKQPKLKGRIKTPHKLLPDTKSLQRWSNSKDAYPHLSEYDWQESPTLVSLSELEKQQINDLKVKNNKNKSKREQILRQQHVLSVQIDDISLTLNEIETIKSTTQNKLTVDNKEQKSEANTVKNKQNNQLSNNFITANKDSQQKTKTREKEFIESEKTEDFIKTSFNSSSNQSRNIEVIHDDKNNPVTTTQEVIISKPKKQITHISQHPTKTIVGEIDYNIDEINIDPWQESSYSYTSRKVGLAKKHVSSIPTKV